MHAQAGTPLNVLQALGGWKTPTMVQRYAHLSAAQLVEHAERISRPRHNDGTKADVVELKKSGKRY